MSLIGSLLLAIGSICVLIFDRKTCTGVQLRVADGIIFGVWTLIFILLLLQVIGCVKCLKKIPKVMFGFYCGISISMWFVQMLLFAAPQDPPCDKQTPLLYWYLFSNVILFYLIVAFGLTTWGAYLCAVADIKEEITQAAIDEYLKENGMEGKHFMITAGTSQPLMLEAPAKDDYEAAKRALFNAQYQQAPTKAITVNIEPKPLAIGPPEFKDYSTTNINKESRGNANNNKALALPAPDLNGSQRSRQDPPSAQLSIEYNKQNKQLAIGYQNQTYSELD